MSQCHFATAADPTEALDRVSRKPGEFQLFSSPLEPTRFGGKVPQICQIFRYSSYWLPKSGDISYIFFIIYRAVALKLTINNRKKALCSWVRGSWVHKSPLYGYGQPITKHGAFRGERPIQSTKKSSLKPPYKKNKKSRKNKIFVTRIVGTMITSSAFGRDMSRVPLWLALRASHKCYEQAYGWPFGPAICKFYQI